MKKYILFTLLFFLGGIFCVSAEKVTDVFDDLDRFDYVKELQYLYDIGAITKPLPDANGKILFSPDSHLTRDEFTGMATEIGCKKCIKPNTSADLMLTYRDSLPFFDVSHTNDYSYCIADAETNQVVRGFDVGYACANGTSKKGEAPFCTADFITLEQAIAILFRNSSVFTIADNQRLLSQIQAGILPEKLVYNGKEVEDVHPTNPDGSPYTYFGYFQKALDFSYSEYDLYGNEQTYQFLRPSAYDRLNPGSYVTKKEFVRMAYMLAKNNACDGLAQSNHSQHNIAANIHIYDKSCQPGAVNCRLSDARDPENTYDFSAHIEKVCELGVKSVFWSFYNTNTKETYSKTGNYIDNYKLPSDGVWNIAMTVEDKCGNTSQSYNTLNTKPNDNNKNIQLQIQANPISGITPLPVNFEAITDCRNCTYEWDFGDGQKAKSKQTTHTYTRPKTYQVQVTAKNKDTNAKSGMTIKVDHVLRRIGADLRVCDKSGNASSGCQVVTSYHDKEDTYDFFADVTNVSSAGLRSVEWQFYHTGTGASFQKSGQYLDNITFPEKGRWIVQMNVWDMEGNMARGETSLTLGGDSFQAHANPKAGPGPLKVDFRVETSCSDCMYRWDFGDGGKSTSQNPSYTFPQPGTYEPILTAYNSSGKELSKSSLTIHVAGGSHLAVELVVYDSSCEEYRTNCKRSPGNLERDMYDFTAQTKGTCTLGMKEYSWLFENTTNGEKKTESGRYLNDYKLPSKGNWNISVTVTDHCGNTSTSTSFINNTGLDTNRNISVHITANPLSGNGPLRVDFGAITECKNCSYSWDFGGTGKSQHPDPTHTFQKPGLYSVVLQLKDQANNTARANLVIHVKDTGERNILATEIQVRDASCTANRTNCTRSPGNQGAGPYDFTVDTHGTCSAGISTYGWLFHNTTTGEKVTKSGKYIDNYTLPSEGYWEIMVTVTDQCGNTSTSTSTLSNFPNADARKNSVQISATPLYGKGPLKVDFRSVTACTNCTYVWDFGGAGSATQAHPSYTFTTPGNYEVTLAMKDTSGHISKASVIVGVNDGTLGSDLDSDGDGIPDYLDKCPYIPGPKSNSGCPILDQVCTPGAKNTCPNGYSCGSDGFCTAVPPTQLSVGIDECLAIRNGSSIYGNVICTTCPCMYDIDFEATLRRCDILLPAVVSRDGTQIYGKGAPYQLPFTYGKGNAR